MLPGRARRVFPRGRRLWHPKEVQRLRLLLVALGCALLLGGCALRFDTPAPTPEPPSAEETLRQEAAIALQALAAASPDALGDKQVADRYRTRVELLGGVWQACPPDASEQECEALPTPPAIPTVTTSEQAIAQRTAAATALKQLAGKDTSSGVVAAGMLPALLAEFSAEDAPVELPDWGSVRWTTSAAVVEALDWGAWQLEALGARSGDKESVALARSYRAAVAAPQASGVSGVRPPSTYVTEQLSRAEIIQRSAVAVAGALPDLAVAERGAVMSYLTEATRQLTAAGREVPASWLAG